MQKIIVNNISYDVRIFKENDITLYCINDIGKILNIKNPRSSFSSISTKDKKQIKTKTNGGDQLITFITLNGLKLYLLKSRSKMAIELATYFDIDINNIYNIPIENSTLTYIIKTFKGEKYTLQYVVQKYRIDLYFNDYKIAIECDENHHKNYKNYDKMREDIIIKELGCVFVRYNPYDNNFDIFEIINEIFTHIKRKL